jgi:hypothetical protein
VAAATWEIYDHLDNDCDGATDETDSYTCDFESGRCSLDDYGACFSLTSGKGGGSALAMHPSGGANCGGTAPLAERFCVMPNGVRLAFDVRIDANYSLTNHVAASVSLLEWPPGSQTIARNFNITFYGPLSAGAWSHYVMELSSDGHRRVYRDGALVSDSVSTPVTCIDDVSIAAWASVSIDNIHVESW